MKRKILSILTAVMMCISLIPVVTYADDSGTCGENLTWTLDSEGTLTISGTGAMTDYTYDSPAPWENAVVKAVIINSGVTSIGQLAFNRCVDLESITIPEGVLSIGWCAFQNCFNLGSLTIPASMKNINNSAFYSCQRLTEINVEDKNENYCSVDGVLFNKDKTVLIKYPASKDRISYDIPEGIIRINGNAFECCNNLTDIFIPDSVTDIGEFAFRTCDRLTNVIIPDSVKTLEHSMFWYCVELKSVSIGSGVTEIPMYLFGGCDKLESIVIPKSVTKIGTAAFSGCDALSNIYYDGTDEQWEAIAKSVPQTAQKNTSDISGNCGKNGDNLKYALYDNGVLIISGIGEMADNVQWTDRSVINEVIINNGVTSIGERVFQDCLNLKSITVPNSVVSVGNGAFDECAALSDIYLKRSRAEWYAISGNANISSETTVHTIENISDMTIEPDDTIYTGYEIRVTVKDGENELRSFTDYEAEYENNINAGTAITVVKGKGVENPTTHAKYIGTKTITFEIQKATPSYTVPTGLNAIHNQKLSDIVLPKQWGWLNPSESVGDTGEKSFKAIFTPTDTDNYNTVEEDISVTVSHMLIKHDRVAATCTEAGNREYWQCSYCSNVFEDEEAAREIDGIPTIDATGHTEVTDTAVEPTCETDGKTAGSHCSVCNTVITEQTIIPKLNHSWGAWSITTEPTFDATGKAERICGNDSTHKEIVDLPILTDTKVWTEDLKIEPTETENGSVTYTSQYGNVTIIIPALNPEYDYSIKYENGKAVVIVPKDDTYTVIFASYDNGRLLSVNAQDRELVKGVNEPIEPEQNFNKNGKVRVMLWDSLTDMKPLYKADVN